MSAVSPDFALGQQVQHPDLGPGVVTAIAPDGYVTVFFGGAIGVRQVRASALAQPRSRDEALLESVRPATPAALRDLWLMIEAAQLPLLESAATLSAAKIDLLPHQIVLTHRVAQATPRRFLIADEVGLGKTVETALILRELASRGQLRRAIMIVPAGLVENWRRELNDTFHLDFEVFGAEGDVTDRKSNAFAKHDRLIVSIDTLKRPARIARVLEAPPFDLAVFDEAHHLTATRSGRKVSKTENYKLAEELRNHARDLLLLSATPHQGDHFRFWMLVRLLEPTLFSDEQDMLANRHRLNAVVIRRTKADACARDGSPLFARRQVHTHPFDLTDDELAFYDALCEYITDGYNLAEEHGNAGRPLGFVMTIFQKLAASSFAAIRQTLERRMLMLTIHESIAHEQRMDVDKRDATMNEAREQLRAMYGLGLSFKDQAQVESLLADARLQLLKRLKQREEISGMGTVGSEANASSEEDAATTLVSLALPEERRRIRDLLTRFPTAVETKAQHLVNGLRLIWSVNPREKVVIFTTYLGSVEVFRRAVQTAFPDAGVEVLKGGDHGSKTAAERRFRLPNGPRVLICTAAGREGINLQFAHVLFNADLPWNPMDLEQRIGRIHRYGQKFTAQVYNLVAVNTIEGKIFLLLEQKVRDIAKTLGKVDEQGIVAEDLRAQILGQLSERISYDRLYQEGMRDPTLQRTQLELEAAMRNAQDARIVVQDLFQDLDSFRLEDYQEVDDQGQSVARLRQFLVVAAEAAGGALHENGGERYELLIPGQPALVLTTNRDLAVANDALDLIGLEQPRIATLLTHYAHHPVEGRAVAVRATGNGSGVLTAWHCAIQTKGNMRQELILWVGVTPDGERSRTLEVLAPELLNVTPSVTTLSPTQRIIMLREHLPALLQRALAHKGLLSPDASYSATLLGWVEVLSR